jgi:hypothetical protein
MQGRSFLGDLVGEPTTPPAEGMYYRYWENDDWFHKAPAHYGYRDERYKIIFFYNASLGLPGAGFFEYPPEWELYDLEVDPEELNNVYFDPAYAEIRETMKQKLARAQADVGDAPWEGQQITDDQRWAVLARLTGR